MPLPDTQDIYKPILEVLRDEAPHNLSINDLIDITAEHFDLGELSTVERNLLRQKINHAKKDLIKQDFLTNPTDNMYIITTSGLNYLDTPEEEIQEELPVEIPEVMEAKPTEMIEEVEPADVIDEPENESDIELEKLEEGDNEQEEQEEFEEIADVSELEELPDVLDDSEEISEVQNEPDDIQIEDVGDEPDDISLSEEPVDESSDIIIENEQPEDIEVEQPDPEDIAEETEPEDIAAEETEPEDIAAEETEPEDIAAEETEADTEAEPEDVAAEETETDTELAEGTETELAEETETETEPETEAEAENETEAETESEPEHENIATEETELESEQEEILETNEETEETYETEETENMNEDMNMNSSMRIEDAIRIHNEELAGKILSGISELPAEMFEVFVIDMLSKMGYRAFHNARYTSEESGNNLIHGVIIDDKTGSPIYIHANKSSQGKTIGRADMQDFIDALSDKGGKGIFATTGKFSEQSEILANDERIMLIDGLKLAGLMISHNFCVKVEKVYEIKDFDTESFSDYQK